MLKRVEGGFIFRVPGLFPRHYLVTEAQKAEIIHSLMHPQSRPTPKRIFLVIILVILAVVGLFLLAVPLAVLLGGANVGLIFALVALYFNVIMLLIPGAGMTRTGQIARILGGARHTKQRITLRERNKTRARLLPLSKLLAAGVGCVLVSALFALFEILAFGVPLGSLHLNDPHHQLTDQLAGLFGLVPFAILAVRWFYLAILKLSLGRSA
jgi:hypothetical protein